MNRSIEQALLSLLPTCNAALPPPLLELASSLLAQSRHRVSTLKAEEEVARAYACAHIACDRLKIPLNLPPIEPRPPIPPRIYKRLYTHLDKTLPASSTPGRIRTPSAKLREGLGSSPSAGRSLPSRVTPSKERSLAQFRTTPSKLGRTDSSRSARLQSDTATSDVLPPWVRPMLRFLCKELNHAYIGPVIMAGMDAIVTPYSRRTADEWVNRNLAALLGALYVYVWKSVEFPDGIDEELYIRVRKDVVETLRRGRETLGATKSMDVDGIADEFWDSWRDVAVKDIDTSAQWINRHGWLDSDWAKGIEDLLGSRKANIALDAVLEEEGANEGETFQVHAGKADAMLQDRYDYLSERKQQEYIAWKEGIMKRIAELERQPTKAAAVDS